MGCGGGGRRGSLFKDQKDAASSILLTYGNPTRQAREASWSGYIRRASRRASQIEAVDLESLQVRVGMVEPAEPV